MTTDTSVARETAIQRLRPLLGWLIVAFIAAAIGGAGSAGAPEFYGLLQQPAWAPPAWLFGPVWTLLYTLMGVSAWLVWRATRPTPARAHLALALFGIQLAVNALWSWTFFAWHTGLLATLTILALDALVIATIIAFNQLQPLAARLLVPYLLWIGFATALTIAIWQDNPALLG